MHMEVDMDMRVEEHSHDHDDHNDHDEHNGHNEHQDHDDHDNENPGDKNHSPRLINNEVASNVEVIELKDKPATTTIIEPSKTTEEIMSKLENDMRKAWFDNEPLAAKLWLGFTATYWTLVIWIPIIFTRSFVSEGFIGWCVGTVGMFSVFYTIKEGKYPSGSTKDDLNGTESIGRLSAFILSSVVVLDLIALAFYDFEEGPTIASDIRGSMHFIHLIWTSLFYFNRFYRSNPDIATTAFFLENGLILE